MSDGCVIGVDLGGTNVRARAYNADGSPAGERYSCSSRAQEGVQAVLDTMSGLISECAASASGRVRGVGIAVPGHIDAAKGEVVWAPNFGEYRNGVFYNWEHIPMGDELGKQTGLPIYMGNDANLAALGEYKFGSGGGSAKCLVLLTLGTGIGGGVVLSPQAVDGAAGSPLLLVGGNGGGGELGHIALLHGGADCNAGSYGALEAYCSRDAIIARAIHRLRRGRKSLLTELASGDLSLVTPALISEAADQGDELALEIWTEVGTWLGVGIGSFINIFAPDVFAIGGQIAKAGAPLLEPAARSAQNVAIPSLFRDARIVRAEQLEDAGMLGGAALALGRLSRA